MKTATLLVGLMAFAPLFASAQDMGGEPGPRPGKEVFFETIGEYTDAETVAALQASRDEVAGLRQAVRDLRDAEEVDEEALQAAREALRSEHRALREEVRGIIEGNDELQAALQEARENVEGRRHGPRRGERRAPQEG